MSDIQEPRFRTELVNPPWEDPALLIRLPNRPETLLLDCGSLSRLGVGALQKIRWVFVSHTHIDHFIGFDSILRMQLFSEEPLTMVGPEGLIEQVAHKLQGYAWNLVDSTPFQLTVFETDGQSWRSSLFLGCRQFQGEPPTAVDGPPPCLGLSIGIHPVEHGVPCLAFRLDEPPRFQFQIEVARELEISPGPWIEDYKAGRPVTGPPGVDLESLRPRLLRRQPSFSLGYLTDTLLEPELSQKLAGFFVGVDQLWCEAAFLEEHATDAGEKLHMTTRVAAELARDCRARRLHIFHQSRRYPKSQAAHLEEAGRYCENVQAAPVMASDAF